MGFLFREKEATLYYLYMMSDGEISYAEEKIFNKICSELDINSQMKKSVIETCTQSKSVKKAAFEIIDSEEPSSFYISDIARITWNLINLGYADKYYSDEEKRIVKHLVSKWEVRNDIYQEMVDTADTILDLTKQKEWTLSTLRKGSKRDNKEREIDEEIESLLSDVKLTIEELDM